MDKKGITLVALVAAISIMMILITSASVIGSNTIANANYEEYRSMISRVEDDVNVYYLKNKELPVINNEIVSATSLGVDFAKCVREKQDENNNLYILNVGLLADNTIKNGRGTIVNKDVFLVAENSNNVYYLKGYRFKGKVTYAN